MIVAYAPSPKNAACPNENCPVYPDMMFHA